MNYRLKLKISENNETYVQKITIKVIDYFKY
jgi:hypothetical protein